MGREGRREGGSDGEGGKEGRREQWGGREGGSDGEAKKEKGTYLSMGIGQKLHLEVAGGRRQLHDKDGRAWYLPLHLPEEGGHAEGGREGGTMTG